ncbi:hypothetical protein GCM10023114_23000 [Mycolicibacterium sediminis]|uniref:Uncharacterized protein n=1 Tax=Mycolicibacterium sediminis TaxID=1286180 RepID=A0A7I7QJK7_9MYCO|nr:hypothetical protein MSEDJ_05510 [Mycolicibacterium sediminis]
MFVPAGDDVLTVVGAVVDLVGPHPMRTPAQVSAALEEGHVAAGLGQPHGGRQPGQTTADHDETALIGGHTSNVRHPTRPAHHGFFGKGVR